eukprot:g15027.t1
MMVPQDTFYISVDASVASVAVVDGHGRRGAILSAAGRDALADLLRRMKSCSAEELAQGILLVDAELLIHEKAEPELSGATCAGTQLSAGDLAVDVSLPSGRSCRVNVSASSVVADLRLVAEKALNVGFLRLISPDGRFLDPALSLCQSGLQSGDTLTAVAQPAKIQATCSAFAKWCSGPSPVTLWGDPDCGGENNEELVEVQEIQSAHEAFAAILGDGTVTRKLKNVQQIQSAHSAFAALLADGSVVTWGDSSFGGDSSRVQRRLKKVKHIQSTGWAFAALLEDGRWSERFREASTSHDWPGHVHQVQSTKAAFAAILADGRVVAWGSSTYGGEITKEQEKKIRPNPKSTVV